MSGRWKIAGDQLMNSLYLISVFLHILSAVIWLGGMLFLALVLVPVLRKPQYRNQAGALFSYTGIQFRWIGWVCLILFLLTGTFNLLHRVGDFSTLLHEQFWQGSFGRLLLYKLLLFGIILLLSAVHDFIIGPRATRLWESSPDSPQSTAYRKTASWFGRINLLLGLAVVFLAVALVRGGL